MTTPSKPNIDFVWADTGDIVEPSLGKKTLGFLFLKKPARQFFNYLINRLFKWAEFLHIGMPSFVDVGTKFFIISGFDKSSDSLLTITMNPGEAILNGGREVTTGTSLLVLIATRDNYITIDDSGVYSVVDVAIDAFPPTLAADTIRVRKVVTDGSGVVSEVDLRSRHAVVDTDGTGTNFIGFEMRGIAGSTTGGGIKHLVNGINKGGFLLGVSGSAWQSSAGKGLSLIDPLNIANAVRTQVFMDTDVAFGRDLEQAGVVTVKDKVLRQHYDGVTSAIGTIDLFALNGRANITPGKLAIIVIDIIGARDSLISVNYAQRLISRVINDAGTMSINTVANDVDNGGLASAGNWADVAGDLTFQVTTDVSPAATYSATVEVTIRDQN